MLPQPADFAQKLTAITTLGAMFISGWAIYYSGQSVDAAKIAAEAGKEQAQANQKQAEAAQAAQLTERFAVAAESLGGGSIDTRIGAIYAFERVMHDSPADQSSVVNLLSTFIRNHSVERSPAALAAKRRSSNAWKTPALDVQEALKVLGRRDSSRDSAPVDLTGSFLFGANINNLDLSNSVFAGADLGGVKARGTRFNKADFLGADLDGAQLVGADLSETDLRGTIVDDAALDGAILRGADLTGASLRRVDFEDTDLTNLDLSSADLSYATITDSTVVGGVRMEGTDLRGADLRDAIRLPEDALTCALVDAKTTKIPTGVAMDWTASLKCAREVPARSEPRLEFRDKVSKRRTGG